MILLILSIFFCFSLDGTVNEKEVENSFTNEKITNKDKILSDPCFSDQKARSLKLNKQNLTKEELLDFLSKETLKEAIELTKNIFKEELQVNKDSFYYSDEKEVLSLARSYLRNQQFEKALDTFKHLLKIQKKTSIEILQEIGEINISFGNLNEAEKYYKDAYKLKKSRKITLKLSTILSWNKKYDEALTLLNPLYKKNINDSEVALLIADVFISKNDFDSAFLILKKQKKIDPKNVLVSLKIADVLAYSGHVLKARQIYEKELKKKKDYQILLRYADIQQIWGDFNKAEKIYVEGLNQDINQLSIAKLLMRTERYYEAESIYKKLQLNKKTYLEASLGLAKTMILERDFLKGLSILSTLLKKYPHIEEAKFLKGEIFFKAKMFEKAEELYLDLSKNKREKAYVELGKVYYKEKKNKLAEASFKKAIDKNSKNYEALFYLWQIEKKPLDLQITMMKSKKLSNKQLAEMAHLYLIEGYPQISLDILKEILEKDKNYFAYLELIQTYEYKHDYYNAFKIIDLLLKQDPENFKMLLWKARILSWDKHYESSINLYANLEKQSPNNSLIIREKARVAMWEKNIKLATKWYDSFRNKTTPLLKQELLKSINTHPNFYKEVASIDDFSFRGYEKLWNFFEKEKHLLSNAKKQELEKIFFDFFASYKNEKAFYLEKTAKFLVWDRRLARSIHSYNRVINFEKNNEEAFFDLGQINCELGFCDRSINTFNHLLYFDPLHDRAHIAKHREIIKTHPEIALNGTFWKEKGRKDLDQIMRNKIDLSFAPLACKNHLVFIENHYFETPSFNNTTYNADGFTMAFSNNVSPYIRYDLGYAKKYYWNSFQSTNQGFANIFLNLNDALVMQLGYFRKDHLENYFALEQGTQESNYKISMSSFLNHKIDIFAEGTYAKFNDGNSGEYFRGDFAYRFTEHPSILKLKIVGEYRNLKDQNIYIYDTLGNLINIIFPYWTPNHYKTGRVLLDWYYDLSKYFFCASELHYIEFKGGYGYDTEKNPAYEINGEWHIEFLDHYTCGIAAMLYRSKIWNAEGVWINFNYRF